MIVTPNYNFTNMAKITEHLSESGLVISYFGNSVAVETSSGQLVPCQLRRNQTLPVVGDRVRWQFETDHTGIITEIEPRTSLLSRTDKLGKTKPLAANIDAIVIVMSPPPILAEHLIDRYLIAAELLRIKPVIVLNKSDLLNEKTRALTLERLQVYQAVPYEVVISSVYAENGLTALNASLANKTAVLVGPSGVGKSSIIAALSEDDIRIGEVSPKGAGKHTTTATRLYHLPQGSKLIDSPGVREFHLGTVTQKDILTGFKEFQNYLSGCKFKDCVHVSEPGCAVQAAAASGKINAGRYAHYQELMKKLPK